MLRGAQLEGGDYVFKIKVVNNGKYNITDVNIHIVSYPEESLILSRVDGHPNTSPDRVKFYKISITPMPARAWIISATSSFEIPS